MHDSPHNHVRAILADVFAHRYTCKRYDPAAHIADEDFDLLLDIARRSPSSFGLEPWKFLVIEQADVLAQILDHAWGAKKNADRTVVILARKGVSAGSAYVAHIMTDVQGATPEDLPQRQAMLGTFQTRDRQLTDESRLNDWAAKQTYIPLANMLTAAALLGIDSTPVEGFNVAEVDALLAERGIIDPSEFSASLIVQFGKAAESHFTPHQTRQSAAEVIERV